MDISTLYAYFFAGIAFLAVLIVAGFWVVGKIMDVSSNRNLPYDYDAERSGVATEEMFA